MSSAGHDEDLMFQRFVELCPWRRLNHVPKLRVGGVLKIGGLANHMQGVGNCTTRKKDRGSGENKLENGQGILLASIA